MTLTALGAEIGYSPQHISGAELAKSPVSARFVAACDHALGAEGALVELFPAVVQEAALLRSARSSARAGLPPPLPCALPHYDVGDGVEPTNRRGLLGAGAGAAAALGIGVAAPTQARQIDPELPVHWASLLRLLGRHDEMFGPRDVLDSVRRELRMIAEHRQAAHGRLRSATPAPRVPRRWRWPSRRAARPRSTSCGSSAPCCKWPEGVATLPTSARRRTLSARKH